MRPDERGSHGVAVLSSGSAPGFVWAALAESPGPARLLGSFPAACYLRLRSGAVIAVLSADAVQLPIGLTLPWRESQLGLRSVGAATVCAGDPPELRLGRLRITLTGTRDAALPHCGRPVQLAGPPDGGGPAWTQLERLWPGEPFDDPAGAVGRLLGSGPGLTPAGDDLLCGALAASALFGIPGTALADAVLGRLAGSDLATTSLSRQLLLRAVAGDGLPELGQLGRALCQPDPAVSRPAWQRVLRIGHSSGAALGLGLLAGARHAAAMRTAAA